MILTQNAEDVYDSVNTEEQGASYRVIINTSSSKGSDCKQGGGDAKSCKEIVWD